jgi:hypothetical protein
MFAGLSSRKLPPEYNYRQINQERQPNGRGRPTPAGAVRQVSRAPLRGLVRIDGTALTGEKAQAENKECWKQFSDKSKVIHERLRFS